MAQSPPDTGNKRFAIQLAILVAIFAVLGLQLYNMNADAPAAKSQTAFPINATTAPAGVSPAQAPVASAPPAVLPAPPQQQAPVGFGVAGRINRLYATDNMVVKQDALLATLDPAPFEQALQNARNQLQIALADYQKAPRPPNPNFAAIEAARANVDGAQHMYDVTHTELLHRRSMQVPGEQDNVYDDDIQNDHDAQVALDTARRVLTQQEQIGLAQMQSAAADNSAVRLAQAAVGLAEKNLANAQLLAPAEGTILSHNAEVGDAVDAGATVFVMSVPKSAAP